MKDFYDQISAGGESTDEPEGFEYRDEDGTSIFVIQFDRYWNGWTLFRFYILPIFYLFFKLCLLLIPAGNCISIPKGIHTSKKMNVLKGNSTI